MRLHLSILLLVMSAAGVFGQERLTFIGVALDLETRRADEKLRTYLSRNAGIHWAPQEMDYERVVDRLIAMKVADGPYVARVTPYVYVVAEMLGAKFEPLATYLSSTTNSRTYRAYLVVRRTDFATAPTLFDVTQFLKQKAARKEPQRFVYHSRFSTSSYFVPSFYFHSNNVYHMPESTESLTAIAAERIQENSSSKLVEMVAQGKANLAAVWDGTKKRYEPGGSGYEEFGRHVHFVELPTTMPNDLLVCASGLNPRIKEHLRSALRKMAADEIALGDFRTWQTIGDAMDARQALADLRWLARARTPAATVEIGLATGAAPTPAALSLLESARQAVRLSGTELVLFDDDFHVHIDFTWTIQPVHDGAVVVRSKINGSGLKDQEFRISFRDPEDLTRRLIGVVQARLHRIRYVWSYSSAPPTIIRDTPFVIPEGTAIKVQRISWLDPERNKFLAGPVFSARIRDAGFYRYDLDPDDFARAGESVTSFDPLSNLSYRAYLVRPVEQRGLFVGLTYALVGLFSLAAVTAVVSFIRGRA